jgi:DNA gyrase subunit A
MVALRTVKDDEDLMIITQSGIIIRTAVSGISQLGRNTMGVRLIRISDGDEVATVARIDKEEETDELPSDEVSSIEETETEMSQEKEGSPSDEVDGDDE